MTIFEFVAENMAIGIWGVLMLPLLILWRAGSACTWPLAKSVGGINLLLTLALWIAALQGPLVNGVLRLGFLQATLLVLVSFLGWIIYRYAASNFRGDSDGPRFLRWLTFTLLAVQTLILVDHLVLFWTAWVAVSLSLHQLLLFYPNRPRALLAAHKKFLIARTAEALLALSIGLIYSHFGSFSLSFTMAAIAQIPAADVPWQLMVAGVCLALVALLKCAQLPLHGWLIQVVESPTPVSALLHAGVINLGGVLLLLFAPLLSKVPEAQWLLLLVAGPSAVLAALIMTTRISIKVRLAWSTCAQMGLMLVECALGLYELALLHLIAHSCYKARAFLMAGSAVNEKLQQQLVDALGCHRLPLVRHWLGAMAVMLPLAAGAIWVLATYAPSWQGGSIVPWVLFCFALITLIAQIFSQDIALAHHWLQRLGLGVASLVILFTVYLSLKTALIQPLGLSPQPQSWAADLWVCSLLLLLAIGSYSLQRWPLNPRVRRAWIALNAGLYLDEWMSRLTLRWWPVTLTPAAAQRSFLETEVKS